MLRRFPRSRKDGPQGSHPYLPPPETEEESSGLPLLPMRTHSPVYAADPAFNHGPIPSGRKLARDRLLDLLRDGEYHSVRELEACLPHLGWIAALEELLARNYAFDRASDHVRVRFKGDFEERQNLAELIFGWEALLAEPDPSSSKISVVPDEIPDDDFNPTIDAPSGDGSEESGDMVLSDPPESLALSIASSVTMTATIVAKKNSGKTYLAMVLAEEFIRSSQVPLAILDPTGVWFGLAASADGQPAPFAIFIFGGRRGHVPITAKDGGKVAAAVNAIRPHAVLVDMSLLAPVEQHEFVADFIDRLFVLASRDPMHIIVDEADEFAPQMLSGSSHHQKRSLDAMDRLVRRGRNKGIGVTMITQRCAVLAKNVLSQSDALFVLNMFDPRDLGAVEARLRGMVTPEQLRECVAQIPRLHPGTAYFVQTGMASKFRRFKVRRKSTFDSSQTPGMGGHVEPVLARPDPSVMAAAKAAFDAEIVVDEEADE